jgi:hypothetical protein
MAAQQFLRLIQQLAFVPLVGALITLLQRRPHKFLGRLVSGLADSS